MSRSHPWLLGTQGSRADRGTQNAQADQELPSARRGQGSPSPPWCPSDLGIQESQDPLGTLGLPWDLVVLNHLAVHLVLEFLGLQGDQRYPSDLAAHPNLELQVPPWFPSEPEVGERGPGAQGGRGPLCLPSHQETLGYLVVLRNRYHL